MGPKLRGYFWGVTAADLVPVLRTTLTRFTAGSIAEFPVFYGRIEAARFDVRSHICYPFSRGRG